MNGASAGTGDLALIGILIATLFGLMEQDVGKAAHPPPSQVDSLEALEALKPRVGCPIVVQFGSERCAHCPQTTLRLSQLTADYTFEWVYKDVSADLCEEFQITRLPALVIWSGPEAYSVHEGLRGAQADSIIKDCCWPRKVELDADF